MYLIFDASGANAPKSWKADYTDVFNWPRMVHISWIVLDKDLNPIKDYNCVVKPEGFKFTEDVLDHCKIDDEDIESKAEDLSEILKIFAKDIDEAQYIFTHNETFNASVVGAEFLRKSMKNPLPYNEVFCLMREATWFCKLKGKRGYKWPSLTELHAICFKQKYSPVNNARADVIAATRCFKKLMLLGELEDCFE